MDSFIFVELYKTLKTMARTAIGVYFSHADLPVRSKSIKQIVLSTTKGVVRTYCYPDQNIVKRVWTQGQLWGELLIDLLNVIPGNKREPIKSNIYYLKHSS